MNPDTIDINDSTYIIRTDEIEYFESEFRKQREKMNLKRKT